MGFALNQGHLGLEQFKHQTWSVTLPAGIEYDAVLNEDAWKHVAGKIQRGDTISVRSEDHRFIGSLYVIAVDKLWVKVKEVFFVSLVAAEAEASEDRGGYIVKWSSPKTLFAVYRKSDGERIKDGFQTSELAAEWLDNHLRQTAVA